MKSLRCCLILILFGLSSSAALANGIDPKVVPIGGTGSVILTSPTDPNFTFSYLAGTTQTTDCGNVSPAFFDLGRTCIDPNFTNTEFINNSGQDWNSITLEFKNIVGNLTFTPTDNANTIDPYFNNSTFGVLDNGNPFVTFFGIDATHPGILHTTNNCPDGPSTCTGPTGIGGVYLYDFSILVDVSDALVIGNAFQTQGSATVPEPATGLLALAGGLLLFLFKRPTLGWTGSSLR